MDTRCLCICEFFVFLCVSVCLFVCICASLHLLVQISGAGVSVRACMRVHHRTCWFGPVVRECHPRKSAKVR